MPVPLPRARPSWARGWLAWADHLVGSDPGLSRLRLGLMGLLTAAAALGAEALLMHGTGALRVPFPAGRVPAVQLAGVGAQHHVVLVVAMLLGAVFAMLSTIGVASPDPRRQVLSMLAGGSVLIGALAAGLALGNHRVWGMVLLVASLAAGTYGRRFGPDWLLAGLCLFVGSLFGTALYGPLRAGDTGWLAAQVGVAVAAGLCVRLTLFLPRPRWTLRRIQASYTSRARKVAQSSLDVFTGAGQGGARLERQLARLNETALMIDVQLADPRSLPAGTSAQLVHQLLFDGELALASAARHAETLASQNLSPARHRAVANALQAVRDGDLAAARAEARYLAGQADASQVSPAKGDPADQAVLHRFAAAVLTFAGSLAAWPSLDETQASGTAFTTPIQLFAGRPAGTAVAGAKASLTSTVLGRFGLRLSTRSAIQIAAAGALAIVAADPLSGKHYYWAVIAVFVTFMGTNHSREQFYKAFYRAAGTLAGVAIGLGVGHALGDDHTPVLIVVVLISVFVTAYFMQINYGLAMIGITVAISLLYVQLGEFSNSLLLTRLEVTAVGAAIAAIVAVTLIPLRARSVLRVALRDHLLALRDLAGHVTERAAGEPGGGSLRFDARKLDAAEQALRATAASLTLDAPVFGGISQRLVEATAIARASRQYGHDLITDIEAVGSLDNDVRLSFAEGWQILGSSLGIVADALARGAQGRYLRSAAYFDRAERLLAARPDGLAATRLAADFVLIDRALAQLAAIAGLDIGDDGPAFRAAQVPSPSQS